MKAELNDFVYKNSKFLIEVPSLKGNACSHADSEDIVMEHSPELKSCSNDIVTVSELQSSIYKTEKYVRKAYALSRNLAKQVLVIMLTDLDRIFKPEIPHATPIAYALTGYSITSEKVMNMLSIVRKHCTKTNITVIAECFDGAFARIATRGEKGEPLTILQLSKDTWGKVTKISKSDQVREMFEFGYAKGLKCYDDVARYFDVETKTHIQDDAICFVSPIVVGFPIGLTHMFTTAVK